MYEYENYYNDEQRKTNKAEYPMLMEDIACDYHLPISIMPHVRVPENGGELRELREKEI